MNSHLISSRRTPKSVLLPFFHFARSSCFFFGRLDIFSNFLTRSVLLFVHVFDQTSFANFCSRLDKSFPVTNTFPLSPAPTPTSPSIFPVCVHHASSSPLHPVFIPWVQNCCAHQMQVRACSCMKSINYFLVPTPALTRMQKARLDHFSVSSVFPSLGNSSVFVEFHVHLHGLVRLVHPKFQCTHRVSFLRNECAHGP